MSYKFETCIFQLELPPFDKLQIMNWLKPKVARFQMPVDIVCLDEFKYTSVGKIDKKHLA